jgi:lipopolysaccharide export LptBFGC system permease protein LptF
MSRPSFLEKEGQVNNSTIVRVFMTLRGRLQDPAVLVIIAVVFLISAVGQAILQALVGDNSVVVTAVLSVPGSVFLAAAIIVASRRDR